MPRRGGAEERRVHREQFGGEAGGVDLDRGLAGEVEEGAPDRPPGEVAGVGADRLGLAAEHLESEVARHRQDVGDQAGLAHAGFAEQFDQPAGAGADAFEEGDDPGLFLQASDHGEVIGGIEDGHFLGGAAVDEAEGGDGFGFAFEDEREDGFPGEGLAAGVAGAAADQGLAGLGVVHQAGGEVDLVAEDAVGAAGEAAVGAGSEHALADADARGGLEAQVAGGARSSRAAASARSASSSWAIGAPKVQ